MLYVLKSLFALMLLLGSVTLWAIHPMSIKKETAAYAIDVKYPQGFRDARINATIQAFIEKTKRNFFKEIAGDADVPADTPGKSGLNITYSIPYKTKQGLSVLFYISIYHRGAAHPSNSVAALNFINGRQAQLSDLFRPEIDYLKPIADFCRKKISSKNFSDAKWIAEGTKPTAKNYRIWSFSANGINIIFDTYQVAAYVYGPQTVLIPKSYISALLNQEVAYRVWSN
ncbi:MAG: DUF3298 domain-containing protein [Gammaproteobacteria bacterium]|nr:DUF3298 domain-containing protein [Gammaproteobacteria bacterium]